MRERIERHPRLALTLLAVLCLLPGIWALPLMDRDEPRFSHATVEMNERGSWAVPYFNQEYRFDKPPLTYWCMEPGLALFGKTEMGARFHSVMSSWLIAMILLECAILLGAGRFQGFLAGAAWLTCLQVALHGRLAVADVLMILWIATSMYCLLRICGRDGRRLLVADRWFWGLVASLALGFLAKGPLALLMPGLALGIGWLVLWRAKQPREKMVAGLVHFAVALVPAMALVALWGIPALLETKGAYFDVGIGKHVVERGTVSFNNRKTLPGVYYLIVMVPFLLPWTSVMPRALRDGWRALDWQRALMMGWFAAPFVIFSFYATQLPHYILPGYPGLMVLIALISGETGKPAGWVGKLWKGVAVGLPLLLGVVILTGGVFAMTRAEDRSLPFAVTGLGCFFLLLAAASWRIACGSSMSGVLLAAAGCVVLWPVFQASRDAHLTVRLHDAVGEPEPGLLRSLGFAEPSLVWYFQRPWRFSEDQDEAALTVVRTRRWALDGKSLRAMWKGEPMKPVKDDTEEALKKLPAGAGPVRFVQGWSPGTNSWLELAYVGKARK